MIDFILSKMNLLILVFSLFVIVTFFMFGLINIFQTVESNNLLLRLSSKAEALAISPAYCDSTPFNLPSFMRVAGSKYYYVLKVSKETTEDANIVIFSILPGEGEQKVIAAQDLRTEAAVEIFNLTPSSTIEFADSAIFNPQERNPIDRVMMVKEIKGGNTYLYIIPCNSDPALCASYKSQAGALVCATDPGCVDFGC